MANEIEKTIEELEAEVLTELEEQAADAPKKGAAPAEPQLKASDASKVTPGGEVQDMGPAVTSPTDASGPGTQAGKKAKETSGDAAQKSEGKPDSMDTPNDGEKKVAKKLAAGDEVEMKDDRQTIQVDTDILLEIRGEELVEGKSPSWIAFEEFVDELYWNIDRFADPDNWMDEQSCRKADCECAVDVYAVYDREQREAKANHYGKQRSWFQTKHTVGYQTKLLVKSLNRLLVNVKKLGEVQ